ncbi:hypothetical protein [Maribacter sp. 4U21]|uniref:hypothetical protein n=1 Tax=Maribacter sp. 4U21 TaxID=1889779 RepID=UPI001C558B29|nr:hypothetical protein [Maribacter sp. 4U21]
MKINVQHSSLEFDSFRANKVKSLFNADNGHEWRCEAELPIEGDDWQIGLIVGPSGSGKTSLGKQLWPEVPILNTSEGWNPDRPLIDDIKPDGSLDEVTGALSAVGLGSVPSWLRPFKVLSNGEQYRAAMARLLCEAPQRAIVDEFTSVVDRQIAKIGAAAFAKGWRRSTGGQVVLLSCHYDVIEWLQPDWVYDTATGEVKKKSKNDRISTWKFGRSTALTGSILKRIII